MRLLLRHRARRIMVVCPAGLTMKWRDEMAEKFGLDFPIVDTERCAQLRRDARPRRRTRSRSSRGLIVSLRWLRGRGRSGCCDEVLPRRRAGDAARSSTC